VLELHVLREKARGLILESKAAIAVLPLAQGHALRSSAHVTSRGEAGGAICATEEPLPSE